MRSIYVETTVVSYYIARPSRDVIVAARQATTRELWPRLSSEYEPYILVLEEAGRGEAEQANMRLQALSPFVVLEIDDAAKELASKIVDKHGMPAEYPEDAFHVAIAAVNGIDLVVTWNFAHLNNPATRLKVRRIVEMVGYQCPEICSPDELLEALP